jgi:para-nitrobenzyl esterase
MRPGSDHSHRNRRTIRADHLASARTGGPRPAALHRRDRLTRVYEQEPAPVRYSEERSRTIWRDRRSGALVLRRTRA